MNLLVYSFYSLLLGVFVFISAIVSEKLLSKKRKKLGIFFIFIFIVSFSFFIVNLKTCSTRLGTQKEIYTKAKVHKVDIYLHNIVIYLESGEVIIKHDVICSNKENIYYKTSINGFDYIRKFEVVCEIRSNE